MKRFLMPLLAISFVACNSAQTKTEPDALAFNPDAYTEETLVMPGGDTIHYRAYENIYFVKHVVDSAYQTLNFYVPLSANEQTPIFLRTYVGGYMAAKARKPSPTDASGRALQEGYVLCIPGSRG